MKAKETSLLSFVRGPKQFRIPLFQRTYSWEHKHCRQLWHDIIQTIIEDRPAHFMGSVVYIEDGLYQASAIPQLLVIDGQQRLSTLALALCALAKRQEAVAGPDDKLSRTIRNYYLLNSDEDGDLRHKLLLTKGDRDTLCRLVEGKEPGDDASRRLLANFHFFQEQLFRCPHAPEQIHEALARLYIVDVSLDRQHDNPQLIFESMNSTGLDLSQADLIRNYVLMGQQPVTQDKLYDDHWFPMEQAFGPERYTTHFDRFMRDFLTVSTGRIPNIRDVYAGFKEYAPTTTSGPIAGVLSDLHRYARFFVRMAFDRERDGDLSTRFSRINSLKVDVVYPFLLRLYADYESGVLGKADLLTILDVVESYVFRRSVCSVPTNALSKVFASLGSEVHKDAYAESVLAALLDRKHNQRFPRDDEFGEALQRGNVYHTRTNHYVLTRLENHGRKEPVPTDEYTIEHIMPQNEKLPEAWRAMLGEHWAETQRTYLHTLGNLTLTGYNAEYGDRPFTEKRDMEGGFRHSPLRLNDDLRHAERWDEAAIQARGERLTGLALAVWACPSLPEEVLARYRPPADEPGHEYTLDDHPFLTGPVGELFESLRARVLALGPSVDEVCYKTYIAYKCGGNFAEVIPQARRLVVHLDVPTAELSDPQRLCEDLRQKGHWATGDTRVGVSSHGQIEDVLDLIEQAFEYQLRLAER